MQTNLSQQFIDYINAGYSCFYLHTAEIARAENLLANVAQQLNFQVLEYNLAQGKVDFKNKSQQEDNQGRLETSLQKLFDEDLEQRLILIKNAKIALENQPLAIARLQHLIEKIERHYQGECAIVLQSAEVYIPADLEPFITLLEMPLPQENEIKALIKQQYANLDDVFLSPFATALSGLNENEIQKLLTLIHNRFKQINEQNQPQVLAEILYQKEQIIAKSGVLEMVKVSENINDIGGLENLKKWLNEQSEILSHLEEAKAFGVKAPKGALIAGMPGCGKSLTAKAAAQLFQQPLLRLDIGSLLGKYVGESETNMRKALAMAESISPCVLWVDELEKAFVGMTGNNASEVSSRLLGYFLTWLQEKTKPVFIIATANDITALPPELLRKGRFDEIFYVGFPNQTERKKILEIHLTKAKQKAAEFNLNELAQLCRDYAGADIENAVYESVKAAFLSPEKQLTQEKIKQAIKNTVPLRKTLKDKVGEYEKKFDELYLTPASNNDGLSIAQMVKMAKDPNYLERKKVAENVEATEDILEDLVVDKELEVRKAAFANPSCPTKLLDAQISLKSDHALYNKVISEIIVKHSNVSFPLAVKICKDTNSYIDELVKNADLSLEENQIALLETAYTRKILVKQPSLFPQVQQPLSNDSDWEIRVELAKNLKLLDEVQLKLAEDSDSDVKTELSNNPTIIEQAQLILAEKEESEIKLNLLNNTNVFESVRVLLSLDYNCDEVLIYLSVDETISEEIQLNLAKSPAENIREELARNINITEKVQLILVEDSDYSVRESLAKNLNITEKTQLILVEDSDYSVREYLAENLNITEKVQLILVEDSNFLVRGYLAENLNITEKVQLILVKDGYSSVRRELAENLNITEKVQLILVKDGDSSVRRALAENLNITEKVQLILVKDGDSSVRLALAENLNITEKVQLILVKDGDSSVRRALARNLNITEKVQLILVKDSSCDVRRSLAENLNITDKVQLFLAGKLDKYEIQYLSQNKNLCKKAQEIIFNNASRIYVIEKLRVNPNLSSEVKNMIDSREYICATNIYKNSDGHYDDVALTSLLVKIGDKVNKGQELVQHEYYKGSSSERIITSPCNGTVEKILRKVGADDRDNNYSIIMIIKKDNA